MKRICMLLMAMIMTVSSALTSYAADGKVTYSGTTKAFIFDPGSEESLTDLFPNFKNVMPGDVLTQKITVRNEAPNYVNVKISLRALGASEESDEFLSQLKLTVRKSDGAEETNLFEAPASESAQLTDWVSLGEFYSGTEVDLDVTLEVPVTLGNDFKNKIGYLDWEFMVEEFPIDDDDDDSDPPEPAASATPPATSTGGAQTGDNANLVLWYALLLISGTGIIILFLYGKKRDTENEQN